jgi:hypothetical protein
LKEFLSETTKLSSYAQALGNKMKFIGMKEESGMIILTKKPIHKLDPAVLLEVI